MIGLDSQTMAILLAYQPWTGNANQKSGENKLVETV